MSGGPSLANHGRADMFPGQLQIRMDDFEAC